jgi:hypothetical protein
MTTMTKSSRKGVIQAKPKHSNKNGEESKELKTKNGAKQANLTQKDGKLIKRPKTALLKDKPDFIKKNMEIMRKKQEQKKKLEEEKGEIFGLKTPL